MPTQAESDTEKLKKRNRELSIWNIIAEALEDGYLWHGFGDLHLILP